MKSLIALLIIAQSVVGVKKYLIPNLKGNWFKAHEFCTSLDMGLVSVESQAEHESLIKFVAKTDKFTNASRFWIGANDLAEEGTYTWVSSGKLVRFTNWAQDEPNDVNSTEHSVEMIHNTYVNRVWQWNDNECRSFTTYFICESTDKQCIEIF